MRQPPALDMSSNVTKFWGSYVHVGVLTYSLGALAVLVYALAAPGPHRQALVVLSGLSLIASMGPFRLLGLRLVETRWSRMFFSSWAACTFVFIAVGAVLDGGVRSPISYFLILPMLFAGLAYSAGTVTFLAGFGVGTAFGGRFPDPRPQLAHDRVLGGRDHDRRCDHGGGGGEPGPTDAPAAGRGQPRRTHGMPQSRGVPGTPRP